MNNTGTPLVSIIIITYNSSRYVLETLESVKAQTWDNIQLIVSDDASKDDTVQLCTDWIEKNRQRFYESKIITVEKNTGIAANCNRGIQATTGEWVKLIAGDDALLDNCVTDNLAYAGRFPKASFIISEVQEMDENSVPAKKETINEGLIYFASRSSVKEQLKAYVRWPVFLNTPTFFYKKELINSIGFCDEEFKIYEDMSMVFRIIGKGIKIHYMNKPTVRYRIHKNSLSRNDSVENLRKKEALKIFNKYRKQNLNIFNPIDLSIYYENWLRYKYKGFKGHKGVPLLLKFSLFYWYLKFNGVRSY
ncbi:MAG: glycosyltransferase [Petrimonas sp.]|nr:glycosyltransferase [Petrimonas sp.]